MDAEQIFYKAIDITDQTQREAYLQAACQGDTTLRARVDALLQAHLRAGDFLQSPPGDPDLTSCQEIPLVDGPGSLIGRYELLEKIGEGGMGLVYLAQQKKPVKRRLALKIIKPGMDSKEVIARFEAERQTLALLDHPNIAHVFDAGTTDTGRPYFVMEYVKGMSITRYCDERKLDIEQRLRLFKEVCEAMQHAHQKGIIHRDIKPSNILISMHGDRAVPKIIDFGIAKAATSALTDKTLFTFQGQLLGTPEYMSPEQVDLATQDIDTRSDIYSLGVVLYELLTGVLPFEKESLQKIGLVELQRTLRELEPASPSIRLSNLGEEARAIAHKRMTQVVPLARRLHRELEWIPLKAMRKDRCRRYKSASDMADDIQNYLNGSPLLAGPETAIYRAQKFVHKHAGSVTTAVLVSVAVIIGLMASIAMASRADQARQEEVTARKQVEQALARAEKAERIAQEQRELAEERAEAYRRAIYGNTLALAKEAIDDDSFIRAQTLLKSCDPDLRGWEWEHLKHMSPDPCIRTHRPHWDDVYSIAMSPDGKHWASAGGEGRICISDTASGDVVMTLTVRCRPVRIAYSPDGRHIAAGCADGSLRIWDAVSGAQLKMIYAYKGGTWPQSVVFSPDSMRIVIGNWVDLKIWDVNSGAELLTIPGHEDAYPEGRMTFSPDGKLIVSGCSQTIRAWDSTTGAVMWTLPGHSSSVGCVNYSPDGSRLVSGSKDGIIKIWDAVTGAETRMLTGHTNQISELVFSPDGKCIASGSWDRTVKIWDAASGDELNTLRGQNFEVTAVVYRPDGKRIFSSCWYTGEVKEWDPGIDRDVLRFHGVGDFTAQVAFSPDGQRIAGSRGPFTSKGITLWDAVSGTEIMTLGGRWAPLAFSPDGKRIAASGRVKRIYVWNAATGALERILTGHDDWVSSVAFSPDSTRIVSGSRDRTVKIWDAATGDTELTISAGQCSVNSAIFSTDGKRIISGGADGTVRIWSALSGTQLLILHGHEGQVRGVSVSSDGHRIASCGNDKTVRVWDSVTGAELMTLNGHESSVRTVAFSPDGKRIISGGGVGQIKVWDAGTGTELIDLGEDPTSSIGSAVFSPDGKSICVGTTQGGVMLLESVEPAGGYGPRQTESLARNLVEELYKKHTSSNDVISRLEEDSTISDSVRKAAIQLANNRLGQDEMDLSFSQSWKVLSSPNSDETEYRKVLETQERIISSEPNSILSTTRLGIAQYRLRAYEGALATLTHAKKLVNNADIKPLIFDDLTIDGFRAMALQQLGREEDMRAIIQQVHRSSRDRRWNKTKRRYLLRLVTEVETFFAGQDSTLVSIWKLIGDKELDKAADLVKEVRLSENAERISRMEDSGVTELLSILYDERGVSRWKSGGESSALIADHERAVRIDPNNIKALTELGRIYVNWPDPDIRDAKKAVEAANRACELTDWKDHETVNILAAACSEAGDLEDAITWQNTALELLPGDCPAAFKAHYQAQLEHYESGKPYNTGGAWSFSDGELVSHWEFDEVVNGEVVDSTGKDHRGRLVGDATIVSDPERGRVLKLGRKGDYVDCGWHPGFNITGAMTIAVWTKVAELNSASEEIFTTDSARLRFQTDYSEFSCDSSVLYKGGGELGVTIGQNSQWHLIVVCYDGEGFTTYIDGEPTSSAFWTSNRIHLCGNIQMDAGPLTIGPRYNRKPMENPRAWKDMLIDDVRIYSYALSPDEVKMLYEGKEPPKEKISNN
jgi:eukaryotic-like serine/threonine-protein kinase